MSQTIIVDERCVKKKYADNIIATIATNCQPTHHHIKTVLGSIVHTQLNG